jgi:large subunit ribosomal protein L7/L12
MSIKLDRKWFAWGIRLRAKALAARLISTIADLASDGALSQAMDAFPEVIRLNLEELLEEIEATLDGQAAAGVEKTGWTVHLDGFDAPRKINVIKVVREITGLGLKEAKDLVEGAPKPVKENISKDEAVKIGQLLIEGGGEVSLRR